MPSSERLERASACRPANTIVLTTLPHLVVGVVTWNSEQVIERTLAAILAQDYPEFTVLVADNASTDRTRELVAGRFPKVELIALAENNGPNPARNRIVERAGDGLALIIDDDCIPTPGCLQRLVEEALARPEGAAFGARVVYLADPERIQFDGAIVHYLCEATHHHSGRLVGEVPDETREVTVLGAGCMLLRGAAWREVGGFDEHLVFGREDGELVQRLLIAGHRAFVVPRAVVRHDYTPRALAAGFYQARNRWLVMLGLYRLRTLLLLAPALLLHELAIAAFFLTQGEFVTYLRANWAVLRDLPWVRAKRRQVAAFRCIPDRGFLGCGPITIREELLEGHGWRARVKRALDAFYSGYWCLVRRFV
ncbi:MAG: glycosyltransferase family 2 protein [Geminicoccaceae bacterium]